MRCLETRTGYTYVLSVPRKKRCLNPHLLVWMLGMESQDEIDSHWPQAKLCRTHSFCKQFVLLLPFFFCCDKIYVAQNLSFHTCLNINFNSINYIHNIFFLILHFPSISFSNLDPHSIIVDKISSCIVPSPCHCPKLQSKSSFYQLICHKRESIFTQVLQKIGHSLRLAYTELEKIKFWRFKKYIQ